MWNTKQYTEEELKNIVPSLRNEHSFLIDSIRIKQEEEKEAIARNIKIKEDTQAMQIKLDDDRLDFERYKEEQKYIMDNNIIKERIELERIRVLQQQEKEELLWLQEIYNKDKVEFENHKDNKIKELDKQREENDILYQSNIDKSKELEGKEKDILGKIDTYNQIYIEANKQSTLAENLTKISQSEAIKAKDILDELSKQRADIESKITTLDKKEKDIDIRDKESKELHKNISDREEKLKYREQEMNDLEYNLRTKEADLQIQEKQLHLAIKQYKWSK